MAEFTDEESYKIQSVLDLFKKYFPFEINGKKLETLTFGGGMGVDVSTPELALACAKVGVAGTIATTFSEHLDELDSLTFDSNNLILGLNNLVKANDYEDNYKRFVKNKKLFDYIASGAGTSAEVKKRFEEEGKMLRDGILPDRALTIPIISDVKQLPKYINLGAMYIILETLVAGGHNGISGGNLEETILAYKSGEWSAGMSQELLLNKEKQRIILAGGIRTPADFAKGLDASLHAFQIASLFLLSKEANIHKEFREYILNAKGGDVGRIVSPAGLPAMGFKKRGVMKEVLTGKYKGKYENKKLDPECLNCLDCSRIRISSRFAGYRKQKISDYCLRALLKIHRSDPSVREEKGLYFCGMEPEKLFIIPYMKEQKRTSLPARTIVGKLLEGVYNEIIDGSCLSKDGTGKITDDHRRFLESRYEKYKNEKNPDNLTGKIFRHNA